MLSLASLSPLWLFGAFAVSFGVLVSMFSFRLRGLIEVHTETPQYISQEQGKAR